MKNDSWNPQQYEKFKNERSQPFYDLLGMVKTDCKLENIIDLGCGTGELTQVLHKTLKSSSTLGTDNSSSMLKKAEAFAVEGLSFRQETIESFSQTQTYDLVFSNAALQWCADHPKLFQQVKKSLKPHGQLAVQMPMNHDHPTHTTAQEVARREPYASALKGQGGAREAPLLTPEAYAQLIFDLGFKEQSVSLKVYPHVLDSRDGAVEWVKGTLLTYYESRLSADLFKAFLQDYKKVLFERLADTRPFFYGFKRILIWARL